MLVVPVWSLWRVTEQAPVASVKHVLTPPEKPPGPDVIVNVTVAASAGFGAFEEATIPLGRTGLVSTTETAAPPVKVPGAKVTLAPPPVLDADPPAELTTVGGVRVAVIVRVLVTMRLGSSSTTW